MKSLWPSQVLSDWQAVLDRYPDVVAAQGVARLPELDRWYREELPGRIAERNPPYVTREELVKVTEWKMARGVWRQRNLVLVRSNASDEIEKVSRAALAAAPSPTAPISGLAKLAGVGPATASAVASAARPDVYPFFDELVAAQVPDLGPVDFTHRYYARYADALRARAIQLENGWTPTMAERALWANSGGKNPGGRAGEA